MGRVINTGDWRLNPEPMGRIPTDVTRLRQLGDEGVLLMMVTPLVQINQVVPLNTPTAGKLPDMIGRAGGRVFVFLRLQHEPRCK